MPDVTRSDSQRSDTSLRPRVSFNRDVHVKRIVPREGGRVVGALSGDGNNGHLVTSPVRKERKKKSKKELQDEAAQVITQVDKVNCVSKPRGVPPEKFYTLPSRHKEKEKINYPSASLDRKWARRNSFELNSTPPRKPQRTFTSQYRNQPANTAPQNQKTSIFDIFKPSKKSSNVRRSVSDATNLKSKAFSPEQPDKEENSRLNGGGKKQLSPIIEVTQREDYFATNGDGSNKENDDAPDNRNFTNTRKKSVTEQLKEYIDEVDEALYRDQYQNGGHRKFDSRDRTKKNDVEVVIIDLDKAEKISNQKKSKLRSSFSKKIKSIANKSKNNKKVAPPPPPPPLPQPAPKIKEVIETLENSSVGANKMMHSSQKPPEKLPLTKGRTVDRMVRRLNHDSCSPPPKTNVLVTPNVSVQHNNNQPFSYTRGLSPEKFMSDENLHQTGRGIIYAQVVCNNDGTSNTKQTVHTTYNKKPPHSDSDEGLGNEEGSLIRNKYKYQMEKSVTHFGDDLKTGQESPIMPKYRVLSYNNYDEPPILTNGKDKFFVDSSIRGRADGMDAKRRESLSEQVETELNISARRDLLESRINKKIDRNGTLTRFNRDNSPSPQNRNSPRRKFYDEPLTNHSNNNNSDYRSSPENKFEVTTSSHRIETSKNLYKSTSDIYHNNYTSTSHRNNSSSSNNNNNNNSYHDSLRRDKVNFVSRRSDKDRFGDSGIENDFNRRDSSENNRRRNYCNNESEDEGFASSLLIASERQHTEENLNRTRTKNNKEYDSDRAYSGEDDPYRHLETLENYKRDYNDYVPRERSIDDGSHFDPRIDKEFVKERSTLKRTEKKPPKPEKKSGLDKVKQLFSRDSKKKKEKKGLVREESLRARYTEYKGSREHLDATKAKKNEVINDYDYSNRRRLSTPSPSPSPTREPQNEGSHNWFKSLDRLSRKKVKKDEKLPLKDTHKSSPTAKNLRFFGDTDQDSSDNAARPRPPKSRISQKDRLRSQSSRELHNISEEIQHADLATKRHVTPHHKSMVNISTSEPTPKNSRLNLKPPASPRGNQRAPARSRDEKTRRRKYEISSVESSTEGDSSQQSQRSVVYLHAATVGDIPGPGYLRNGNGARRASSREELQSFDSGRIQPHVKTLSRSFSVLAPWKPRYAHEANDIDYSQQQKTGKYEKSNSKISSSSSRKENSTLKKKAQDSRRSNQNNNASTLNRSSKNRSKENLSNSTLITNGKGSSSTLYKKKEKLPRENSRYTQNRDDHKKMSTKSQSVESLRSSNNDRSRSSKVHPSRDISRSISMPKDPEKSAGWFKMSKKNHHKSEYRL